MPYDTAELPMHWLTTPVAKTHVQQLEHELQLIALPIPAHIGRGQIERLPLDGGISVAISRLQFDPRSYGTEIPLGEFSGAYDETTLTTQTAVGARVHHCELKSRRAVRFGHDRLLFRYADGHHLTMSVEAGPEIQLTWLCAKRSALRNLIGSDLQSQLLERIGLTGGSPVQAIRIPDSVSAPLRESSWKAYHGTLMRLFAQAKALEYLSRLASHLECEHEPGAPGSSAARRTDADVANEVHEQLTRMGSEIPSLESLAQQFGLSARRLNELHVRSYGQTLTSFIVDQRLRSAYLALQSTDTPMKQIAGRLGYSHFNNFAIAFKRRFGIPPGQVRRDQKH